MFQGMLGCSQVYHLAALAKVWSKNKDSYFHCNVTGTKNVLDAAITCKIKRVVVCSTAGVYGASLNGVISEDTERTHDFFNEYESSKAISESLIKDYIIQQNLDIVIASPTRVYGPYPFGKPESVTFMVEKYVNKEWKFIPGKGDKIGNYIFINDVISGLQLAMLNGIKGHTYLLGGTNHDLIDFFDTLKKVSNIKVRMYKIPIWLIMLFAQLHYFLAKNFNITPLLTPKWIAKTIYHWEVSSKKAQKELGLEITPLETGLEKTVAWLNLKKKLMYHPKNLKPC